MKNSTFGFHDEESIQETLFGGKLSRRQHVIKGQDQFLRQARRIGESYAKQVMQSTILKDFHPADHRAAVIDRCMESHCGEFKNSSGIWMKRDIVNAAINATLQFLSDNNFVIARGIELVHRDIRVRGLDEYESADVLRNHQLERDRQDVEAEIVRRERRLEDLKRLRSIQNMEKRMISML